MKIQLNSYGKRTSYIAPSVPILTKILGLFIMFFLVVNVQSFGQKRGKESFNGIFPDLAKILDDPLSDSACDMIKIAYLDFKSAYIEHLKKKERGFKKSKERQQHENDVWDNMINETDESCRKEIIRKWTVKGFCGQIGATQYYSPC